MLGHIQLDHVAFVEADLYNSAGVQPILLVVAGLLLITKENIIKEISFLSFNFTFCFRLWVTNLFFKCEDIKYIVCYLI